MPIVVRVVPADEYTRWVAAQREIAASVADDPDKSYALDELKARGEKVYAANCVGCHQATGKGVPPAFPALDGSKLVNGPKNDQLALVLNGKPGTAMVAFGKQLDDLELAAVVTFTRNAWGNRAGEAIQPSEVKALRK
jgi:cytochrome c oxidase subunit 2